MYFLYMANVTKDFVIFFLIFFTKPIESFYLIIYVLSYYIDKNILIREQVY